MLTRGITEIRTFRGGLVWGQTSKRKEMVIITITTEESRYLDLHFQIYTDIVPRSLVAELIIILALGHILPTKQSTFLFAILF